MAISDELTRSADTIVEEILRLQRKEAVAAIVIVLTYLINWSAYKLRQEEEIRASEDLLSFSSDLEQKFVNLRENDDDAGAQVLKFPPTGRR